MSTTPPVLALDIRTGAELAPHLPALARATTAGSLGALTVSDGGLHPVHVASALAPITGDVALLPRADLAWTEPFHLATQLMSLDHTSRGRAGWLLHVDTDPAAPRAVGRQPLTAEQLQAEAVDVLEAARRIWDSWTDDAIVRDVPSGRYLDAGRLQYVDYTGDRFFVRGPSITPRSPQGLVPTFVADADRETVGPRAQELADGRALDVRLEADAGARTTIDALRAALGGDHGADVDGGAHRPRLVRLLGLDPLREDLGPLLAEVTTALRADGLIAPAPAPGATLRDQLGLPRPAPVLDPSRRADRARTAA